MGKPIIWAAGLAVILFIVLIIHQAITNQKLRIRQGDFSDKGFTPPEKWDSGAVAARVSEMMEEYNVLLAANSSTSRINDLEGILSKPEA